MTAPDPASYGPKAAALLADRLPALGPGSPNAAVFAALKAFDPARDLGKPAVDPASARACLAGLWLLHDGLDESHAISQGLTTPEGSYWHALMHRREPDAWNSKYWFRQLGDHPVVAQLLKAAPELGYAYTTPAAFVDFGETVRGSGSADEELAKRVQALEIRLLFDWCYRKATGA